MQELPPMPDTPRLIEFAFPLKQASLDSVHEKNVRHGHISTLHIWPARRPLAACRAALIATLLPDPGTPEKRQELCEKIGGKVVKRIERKKMPGGQVVEREKEETEGGILHWGRETENAETLQWFRDEIKKAYGGRAPKVLDPFAGGGAIPLEAMRLGCEATAVDINPVAWFILKCTLEYPQKLAGQKRPLPAFILENKEFMEAFLKSQRGTRGRGDAATRRKKDSPRLRVSESPGLFPDETIPEADLAWHVRAWGQWVLDRARRELAKFYPVYADFEPLDKKVHAKSYERQPMRLVPLKDDGTPDIDALNGDLSEEYLSAKANPRWIAKPTVAYLWARTVICKNCRATIPLLKTRWLCKKDRKRVLLTMEPNSDNSGVDFGVETTVPVTGGNAAQRREHDKRMGIATMSRAGAKCPCCATITATDDIQTIAQLSGLPEVLTCAVMDGPGGREYRPINGDDAGAWDMATTQLESQVAMDQFGPIDHPIDPRRPSPNSRGLSGLPKYGIRSFADVFNHRQQLGLFVFAHLAGEARRAIASAGDSQLWSDAISDILSLPLGKLADYASKGCTWSLSREGIGHTFTRFALPMTTDYAEINLALDAGGGYGSAVEYAAAVLERILPQIPESSGARVAHGSATSLGSERPDVVITDPPYYDSIPYSDISDYFYIWLRRAAGDRHPCAFATDLVDRGSEIIQHAGRLDGDNARAKNVYEQGMALAFEECRRVLSPDGRLVIVFAHKQPDAWETLAAALIRAGFVVHSSWPIQTERDTRFTSLTGSGLASSVWLVCKKRSAAARPGWDNKVLEEMRANIRQRLNGFWDAGIRGPDFVWAATGPALEAYSKHPVVKMANEPNATLSVSEFLNHARRMVVDFVVGRVLSRDSDAGHPHPSPLPEGDGERRRPGRLPEGEGVMDEAAADRLDEPTAYYLLHRNDFNLDEAPIGACILYATACGLSDQELVRDWDLLVKTGADAAAADEENTGVDSDEESTEDAGSDAQGGGSKVKLKAWNQRRGRSLGYEAPGGRPVPLIDRIHRLMQLWRAGDVYKVDEYLDEHGLRRHELFRRVLQSLIELAKAGSEERSLLESLSNHIGAKGARKPDPQKTFITASAGQEGEGT